MTQDIESVPTLLAHTPSTLHWIFASRTDPALRASRYRAMQEVIDIGEADLAFRMDEIRRLYADLLKIPMTESATYIPQVQHEKREYFS